MGEETQGLRLEARAVGFDQAAKEVDKVGAAQDGVTEKVEASSGAKDAATEATEKLKASESDLTSLLTQINPQLGAFADALFKGGKIAGDLASQQISLGGAMAKATGFIKANAGALKLLAASGAVVIGIMAIVRAIRAVREEADRATEAIKRQQDALNELKQEQQVRQQAIEDIADQRREGGLDADESRRALQLAESIGKQFEKLKAENIDQVVGLLSGKGFSKEEITQAAILQQTTQGKRGGLELDPQMPAHILRRAFESALTRNQDVVATFVRRETIQGQGLGAPDGPGGPTERGQEARKQASATSGATIDLKKLINDLLGPGGNVERMLELVRAFGGSAGALEEAVGPNAQPFAGRRRVQTPQRGGFFGVGPEFVTVTGLELAELTRVLNSLDHTMREQAEQPRTVNIHNNNVKNTYPSAKAKQEATKNGESGLFRRAG